MDVFEGGTWMVILIMVVIEFIEVSVSTISKAAMTKGMSQYIHVLYSNLLGICVLLPFSLMFYRKRERPRLTMQVLFKLFLLGIMSGSVQLLMNAGIKYSSPTLASAIADLIPAFTFLVAIFSGIEKLDLRNRSSQAKTIGTLISIGGGLMVTLYKGQPITSNTLQNNASFSLNELLLSLPSSNWIVGGIFLITGSFLAALILITVTWILKDYPSALNIPLISSMFATIPCATFCLVVEKDINAWTLLPDVGFISVALSAVFQVSLRTVVHTWACRMKGPVFTAMFRPLEIVIAIILGILFLGDVLYIGSVIGAIIIACGFYAVIFGNAQDEKVMREAKVPLLKVIQEP